LEKFRPCFRGWGDRAHGPRRLDLGNLRPRNTSYGGGIEVFRRGKEMIGTVSVTAKRIIAAA
jgi:hypothetical protein